MNSKNQVVDIEARQNIQKAYAQEPQIS